jgi:hypothetical protein
MKRNNNPLIKKKLTFLKAQKSLKFKNLKII